MNRIAFFYDKDLTALELKINKWLSANKEKKIIGTNLNSLGTPGARSGITNTEKYVFYILYSTADWESLLGEKSIEEALPEVIPFSGTKNRDAP